MGLAQTDEYRAFTLHIRCENCMRETTRGVAFPMCAGMPSDADELLSSAVIENVPFQCAQCESVIGRLFGISEGGRL